MLPTKLELPSQLPTFSSVPRSVRGWLRGNHSQLSKSAVMQGIFLTVFYLTEIQKVYQFPLPGKGEGSGKKGGVTKPDYAEGLIQFLWPDESSESKKRNVRCHYGRIPITSQMCKWCDSSRLKSSVLKGSVTLLKSIKWLSIRNWEKERKIRATTELREEQKTFYPFNIEKFASRRFPK